MQMAIYRQILEEEGAKEDKPLEEMLELFQFVEYKDCQPIELTSDVRQWFRIDKMKGSTERVTSQISISVYPSHKRKLKQIREIKKNFSLSAQVQELIDQIHKDL